MGRRDAARRGARVMRGVSAQFASSRGARRAGGLRCGAAPGPGTRRRAVRARQLAAADAAAVRRRTARWRKSPCRCSSPALAGDALAPLLPEIAAEAFNFPAPLVPLDADGRLAVLELFHGPTAAFKDFGARFLAACFARLPGAAAARTHHPRGHLRGHRRCGGGGLPPPPRHRGGGAVPQGAGLPDPGAPAHLLGRQRALARACAARSMTASAW